jgi:hypothetical protein
MTNVTKMEIFEFALDWIYYPIWVHDINDIIAIFMHPSHHHCTHIQVPNQLLSLPHMNLCVLLHFLNSDFTNQNNKMRKIHLFFKLLRRITNKENFTFMVFTTQWISSIKCHSCSNQVTIMTNFKFVYNVVVHPCTHDFQIKYLVQTKSPPQWRKVKSPPQWRKVNSRRSIWSTLQ